MLFPLTADIQYRALAHYLQRPVEIHTTSPTVPPTQIFGRGDPHSSLKLLLVPLEVPCLEVTRYCHLVPLLPYTEEEQMVRESECGASSKRHCQGRELTGWVQCGRCQSWLHDACIGHTDQETYEEQDLHCGCHKVHPLIPKR